MPNETQDEKRSCFIAMPVRTTKAHAEHFGDTDHWNHVMETLFVPAVEAAGYEAWRPVAKGSHLIHAEIVRQLEQADMVLCDMSQNNPNVFFELGVRTSVNKPVALVRCDEETPIPFDVSGVNTHTYNPALKAWHIQGEVDALATHIREAETSCNGENPIWKQFGLVLKAQEPTSGESREEALLSVLAHQVDNLTSKVNAVAHNAPRNADLTPRRFQEMSEYERELIDNVITSISALAAEYKQVVDLEFQPGNGLMVVSHPSNGTREGAKAFRSEVVKTVENHNVRILVHFATRSPSGRIADTDTFQIG